MKRRPSGSSGSDKPETPVRPDWLRSLRGIRGMERACPECGAKAGELHAKDCSHRIKRGKPNA